MQFYIILFLSLLLFIGLIVASDLTLVYTTTGDGIFNQTKPLGVGISLFGTNTTGEFSSHYFYNATESYWNVTLGHNYTAGNTTQLLTRTSNSYNFTDKSLVGAWTFNGDVKDSLGFNNGTIVSEVWVNQTDNSVFRESAHFVGVSDAIDLPDSVMFNLTTGSIVVWSSATSTSTSVFPIFDRTSLTEGYRLGIDENNRIVANLFTYEGNATCTAVSDLSETKWDFIVMTFNITHVSVYLNGIKGCEAQSGATTMGDPSIAPRIGARCSTTGSEIRGNLDELRIYNRTLTDTEVWNLYVGDLMFNWNSWKDENLSVSNVVNVSQDNGTIFQFKTRFVATNQKNYLFNHTVIQTDYSWGGGAGDTTLPYFTTIPSNASISYLQNWAGVDFEGTDAVAFDKYAINYTTLFEINQTGFLKNNSALAGGVYMINVTINDSSNNINWTVFKLEVNKINPSLVLSVSPSWNTNNNTNVTVTGSGCPSQLICNLTVDGDFIDNPNSTIRIEGTYDFSYNATGNANYTYFSVNNTLTIINYTAEIPSTLGTTLSFKDMKEYKNIKENYLKYLTVAFAVFFIILITNKNLKIKRNKVNLEGLTGVINGD